MIQKEAKALGRKVEKKEIKKILLKEIKDIEFVNPKNIMFDCYLFGNNRKLNACCTLCEVIALNGGWATELVLGRDDVYERKNALRITLGHEMTHLKYNWKCKKKPNADKKFSHWVDEIHADFGAAEIASKCSRKSLISFYEYKLKKQRENDNKYKDKPTIKHPSLEQRMGYAKEYDFDEKLIKQIAKDTGCKNKKLIQKSCDVFNTIHLK